VQKLELGANKRVPKKSAAPGGAPQEVLPGERELGAAATIANEITGAVSGAVKDVAKSGAAELPSIVSEAPSPVTGAPSPVTEAPSPVTEAPSPAASDVGTGAGAASPAASDVVAGTGAASPASTGQAASTGGQAAAASPAEPVTSAQSLPPGVEWWENGGPEYAMVLTPMTMVDNAPSDQQVKEETKDQTMGVPFIFNQDNDSMSESTINDIAQVFDHPIPEEHKCLLPVLLLTWSFL
jgi:hypothetical protein